MSDNPLLLLGLSTFFAALPVVAWIYLFFHKAEKSKKTVAIIFAIGCLTAPALLGMQYLWDIFPRFNLSSFIEDSIDGRNQMFIALFVLFGALEEIIKMMVVRIVDKRTLYIQNVNDAIRYSLVAALGFSFTENVYYLYEFWPSISLGELGGMYMFRSLFTMCAHMIFSGIFGYYYGIGKFSLDINKQKRLQGKISWSAKAVSKVFNLPLSEGYRQKFIIKGLFLAVTIHATFNYLLQFNVIVPVIIFVILGYLFLRFLLSRKAGDLVMLTDISNQQKSDMERKDEDVVVDLITMWFEQKNYVDALHICERLLEKDPDNKIVQMFKAQAKDKMDDQKTYQNIVGGKADNKNIISRHIEEKEMFKKVKGLIKKQVEKEGKTFVDQQLIEETEAKRIEQEKQAETKKEGDVLDKYTDDGSFKVDL
jgi:RsiW-degrading membrane proteinase PrsW (M82 family)